MTLPPILFLLTTFFSTIFITTPARHLLHQPLFPLTTLPPSPSPQPQTTHQSYPKYPFTTTPAASTSTSQNPFFPSSSYSSTSALPPPPPSSAFLSTFPANISSLLFPHRPNTTTHRHIIIVIAISVSLLFAAVLSALSAFLIYFRLHHTTTTTKATDSIRLFPPDTTPSDSSQKSQHNSHITRTTPNSSTEFLYLGTLVNSRNEMAASSAASVGVKIGTTKSPPYQRLGSPELKPLPPLPRHNYSHSFKSGEVESSRANECDSDNTEEEFFSPRGSSERKDSGGSTAVAPPVVVGESSKFSSRNFDSRTASCPYSNSYSQSNSLSPSSNASNRSIKSRSPDSIIDFPVIPTNRSSSSHSNRESGDNMHNSPETTLHIPTLSPPQPPPPPPPGFWDVPVVTGPPELLMPSGIRLTEEQFQEINKSRSNETTPKLKLKPLHWDKVRASSDREMVWDQIKSSSFRLNEEMIETLFVVNNGSLGSKDGNFKRQLLPSHNQENQVLEQKKSQNIAILLRALNVTTGEVCESLLEGNLDTIGTELLESLLKMLPTEEEERKLKEYKDDSPFKLGPAEKFLRSLLDIPFAFKRVEAMLYIANFDSEVEYLKKAFETLQDACGELRNSRMFLKLLEAVLKTGNRMNVGTNRGDAHAFKLDTLLKLVDIKGTDGKTTLLHFVVQEIIRTEGFCISGTNSNQAAEDTEQSDFHDDMKFKKLGLQVVSSLSGELNSVKKAAAMDYCILSNEVEILVAGISKIGEVISMIKETGIIDSNRKFNESMIRFSITAEEEILKIQAQEREALVLVKEITEYFHGNLAKEEAHPFRIFTVVSDFLSVLDQVCKEVGKVNERSIYSSVRPMPVVILPSFFSGNHHSGSSDDESSSST